MIYIAIQEDTHCIYVQDGSELSPRLLELCAGFGGLGIGAGFLGAIPWVSVDWNQLACDHLTLNSHGTVLQQDLLDLKSARVIHEEFNGTPGTTTMGFPCQPHSSQGSGLGTADPRHMTFWGGLRVIFLTQSQTAILECVPGAGVNSDVQKGLQMISEAMHWDVLTITFDLQDQWPCRRRRWWALMLPKSWNVLGMDSWPSSSAYSFVGSLFAHWGAWSDDDEENLQLLAHELARYGDPDYGNDERLLQFSSKAPCFLHSYGNALQGCPCGCRAAAFNDATLRARGLRGTFVPSRVHGNPRFMHPREVGLLLGVPDSVTYGKTPREDLALLGLISSPMQMVWVYGHLRCNFAAAHGLEPLPHPEHMVKAYKQELLVQAGWLFQMREDGLTPQITITDHQGTPLHVCSAHAFTVSELLQAERINLGWNEAGGITSEGLRLPLQRLMNTVTGPSTLEITHGIPSRPPPEGFIMVSLHHQGVLYVEMATPGQFLFELMRQHGISSNFLVDNQGRVFGADYRIWRTLDLYVMQHEAWPLRLNRLHGCGSMPAVLGLHDGQIWDALLQIFAQGHQTDTLLIHPRTLLAVSEGCWDAVQLNACTLTSHHEHICCIFAHDRHWALLWAMVDIDELHWTYSDGMPGLNASAAGLLAGKLTKLLGFQTCTVESHHQVIQKDPHTCGTVALCHVLLRRGLFGIPSELDVLRLHEHLLTLQGPGVLYGAGLSPDQMDKLANLLHQHGVPQGVAQDRALLVVTKLGPNAVMDVFTAKNPWAYLKALASKPSINLRLVHADELSKHVEDTAASRFGAGIASFKQKKKDKKLPPSAPPILDPSMLQLTPGGFMDSEDDDVPQIRFQDVTAEAHGIAICNLAQGMQLLQTMKSISCYALGLLIVETPSAEMMEKFQIENMTFTAVYKGTGEPVLVYGAFKQLGDLKIRRLVPGHMAKPEVITTRVIKVQVFRDEFQGSWETLVAAPVKTLCQHVPLLQFCNGKNCGKDCKRSHAAIDEELDTILMEIWGRSFANTSGGKMAAPDSSLFWVFLRIPLSVVHSLLQLQVAGIYFEPRDPETRSHDSRYRVIWLPAKTLDQAQHVLRTCVHAIGLVRMRMKYGIRVEAENEESAFKEVKPDATFINTQVQRIYQLFPLPHGLQRAGICKLLESFQWRAKPLQPGKGNAKAMSWTVGSAVPPPSSILMGFDAQEILITEVTKESKPSPPPRFLASQKTKKHVNQRIEAASSSSGAQSTGDPWLNPTNDPWASFVPTQSSNGKTHIQEVTGKLRQEMQDSLKKEVAELRNDAQATDPQIDQRFQRIESTIGELQAQGNQFNQWFTTLGQQMQANENTMEVVQTTLSTHQQEIFGMRQDLNAMPDQLGRALQSALRTHQSEQDATLNSRFTRLEALMEKKHRTETKEELAIGQGPGIWTYSETQLSSQTQASAARALRVAARLADRHIRPVFGAPAPLRPRSTWAGSWTGVACVSDYPSKKLQIEWPQEVWDSGRVLATQHFVSQHVITVISLYGLPRGPTWPNAAQIMNDLLAFISKTFVFGHTGMVAIQGDFNFGPFELDHFHLWRSLGWTDAQSLAADRWSQERQPTCKGSTERDLIWMSPSLASLCSKVIVEDCFAEHSSVSITIDLPEVPVQYWTWPRPGLIPWEQVQIAQWHDACDAQNLTFGEDTASFLAEFADHYESSLSGHIHGQPGLWQSQCGRAQRLRPQSIKMTPKCSRASRRGEMVLTSDLVGHAVQQWFKQARRLQSYVHSIRLGNMDLNPRIYRIELWSAILRSRGFSPTFPDWWAEQPYADVIGPLPRSPPNVELAEEIFRAFQHSFRQFERWHLDHKAKMIQTKYDRDLKAIFNDLRTAAPDQIDVLWTSEEFTVQAIKPDKLLALLDREVQPIPSAKWFLRGCEIPVFDSIEGMVALTQWPDIEVGDTLIQHTHTQDDHEAHSALLKLWKRRWQDPGALSEVDWTRVNNFVQAFMPRFPFQLEDVTVEEWHRTVRRLKPHAARGADGFSKLDLQNMSISHTEKLLSLFHAIEKGDCTWPTQFYTGLVLGLAKTVGAHEPGDFRPIVLFSMMYRIWGSLRCRQLLRQLEHYAHSDALGFMPGRETLQAWMQVQSAVELALQSWEPLAGLATDMVKAFNSIQRPQWFLLASHCGFPQRILKPWKNFLSNFNRRFQVNNHLSEPVWSSVGFAEGDPLSVAAMALLDWTLHVYQDQMAPQVRTLSFVDNVSLVARDMGRLFQSFFSLQVFLKFWGLVIDLKKSYAWSTNPTWRRALRPLGLQVVEDVSELGGSLSLSAATRVRVFLQRGKKLENKWHRLRTSKAPLRQKLASLPMVFWAAALHGANGSVFADSHIHELRKKAVSFLKLKIGGSNPVLRLSLAEPMTADPGFYQLWHCVFNFRRICWKTPDLLQQWRFFMNRYMGKQTAGPFYKLLMLFHQIGWSIIDAPLFLDHDGCQHDLLQLPNSALDSLLRDAWLQWVSSQVRHRRTMMDLQGLDGDLVHFDRGSMTPAMLGRVMALQSGAFMSASQKSKFDSKHSKICSRCNVEDDQRHWFRCPRFATLQARFPNIHEWFDDAPSCVVYHLLPPKNPFIVQLKHYFMELRDSTGDFCSEPSHGVQHLFSDGSCFQQPVAYTSTAAWSVVNATTGQLTGHGLLPGLVQTSPRAELTGVIAALRWTIAFGATVLLWCDSLSVVKGVQQMMSGSWHCVSPQTENHDLWADIFRLLEQISDASFQIAWIPSHLAFELCTDSFEEWICCWNNIVDQSAVSTNEHRTACFQDCRTQALAHHSVWRQRLCDLRDYYAAVADADTTDVVVDLTADIPSDTLAGRVDDVCLSEALPVNWGQHVEQAFSHSMAHSQYVVQMLEFLFEFEDQGCHFMQISFVELAMWMTFSKSLPVLTDGGSSGCILRSYRDILLKPTVASVVQCFRQTLKKTLRHFGLDHFIQPVIDRSEAGVMMQTDGIIVSTSTVLASEIAEMIRQFSGQRLLRKAADLARPF
eukprot:Skav215305  [mRNA]  locus=scaffold3276:18327:27629:- [translate_table: standard]